MDMDQWQDFRFLVWPFVVGATTTQCMYIMLWILVGSKLKREHAIACIVAGVFSWLFAFSVTRQWDDSSVYWMAFTIGLCFMAGVMITTSGLLVARIWKS